MHHERGKVLVLTSTTKELRPRDAYAGHAVLPKLAGKQVFVSLLASKVRPRVSNAVNLLDKLGWRRLCIEPVATTRYEERLVSWSAK